MQSRDNVLEQGRKIAAQWKFNLNDKTPYLTQSGMCLRFIRVGVQEALGKKAWPVPQGADAKEAYEWFEAHDLVLPPGAATIPGDICFWVTPKHGPHGHVAGRILGNLLAENSSLHIGKGDTNAIGTRPLSAAGSSARWVRLPLVWK